MRQGITKSHPLEYNGRDHSGRYQRKQDEIREQLYAAFGDESRDSDWNEVKETLSERWLEHCKSCLKGDSNTWWCQSIHNDYNLEYGSIVQRKENGELISYYKADKGYGIDRHGNLVNLSTGYSFSFLEFYQLQDYIDQQIEEQENSQQTKETQ